MQWITDCSEILSYVWLMANGIALMGIVLMRDGKMGINNYWDRERESKGKRGGKVNKDVSNRVDKKKKKR